MFKDQLAWASNMHSAPFVDKNGVKWACSEIYYQAHKFPVGSGTYVRIAKMTNPYQAKTAGKSVGMREDWDAIKVNVMKWALWYKFSQNEDLKARLLNCPDNMLVEENYWHDNFWGACSCPKCKGVPKQNTLGELLKQLKAKFLNSEPVKTLSYEEEEDLFNHRLNLLYEFRDYLIEISMTSGIFDRKNIFDEEDLEEACRNLDRCNTDEELINTFTDLMESVPRNLREKERNFFVEKCRAAKLDPNFFLHQKK